MNKMKTLTIQGVTFEVVDEQARASIPEKIVQAVNGVEPDENGNVTIEISGGGVSSWNDLTDKPFYEEYGRITLVEGVFKNWDVYERIVSLDIGTKYIIEYDGVEYNSVAFLYYDIVTIGAATFEGEGDFSQYPFSMQIVDDGYVFLSFGDDKTHSVRVMLDTEIVKPIDTKYMPKPTIITVQGYSSNELTADKTYREIYDVIRAGVIPYCRHGGSLYYLVQSNAVNQSYREVNYDPYHTFTSVQINTYGTTQIFTINIYESGKVEEFYKELGKAEV